MFPFTTLSSSSRVLWFIAILSVVAILSPVAMSDHLPPTIRLPSENVGDNEGAGVCSGSIDKSACPVKCFLPDPVCGVDGVTYWCGCADALCAGTKVTKIGYCEVRNGGSSGQALLLVQIIWLILLGFLLLFGFF